MLTKTELNQALEWLKDCDWADMESEDFDDLTDAQIQRGIVRHFTGGIEEFKLSVSSV